MIISARIYKLGDNVDTDDIISAQYLQEYDARKLASHIFELSRPGFREEISESAILVAGLNFGCGSAREHAAIALKAAGVQAIVAVSYARIFFRNAINIGLPLFECAAAAEQSRQGQHMHIDTNLGLITIVEGVQQFPVSPFPAFIDKLIACGGLVPYINQKNS